MYTFKIVLMADDRKHRIDNWGPTIELLGGILFPNVFFSPHKSDYILFRNGKLVFFQILPKFLVENCQFMFIFASFMSIFSP